MPGHAETSSILPQLVAEGLHKVDDEIAGELEEVLHRDVGVDGKVLHAVVTLLLNTEKVEKQTRKNK